jgi:uncharacterized membrane protein YhaH (DUF805 family)
MAYKSPPIIQQITHAVRITVIGVADYSSRGTRTDLFLGLALVNGCAQLAGDGAQLVTASPAAQWLISAIALAFMAPLLVRRMHDMGYSGWWLLVPLSAIPLSAILQYFDVSLLGAGFGNATMMIDVSNLGLLAIPLIIMMFIPFLAPDDLHENRFGPNPRYPDSRAVTA